MWSPVAHRSARRVGRRWRCRVSPASTRSCRCASPTPRAASSAACAPRTRRDTRASSCGTTTTPAGRTTLLATLGTRSRPPSCAIGWRQRCPGWPASTKQRSSASSLDARAASTTSRSARPSTTTRAASHCSAARFVGRSAQQGSANLPIQRSGPHKRQILPRPALGSASLGPSA